MQTPRYTIAPKNNFSYGIIRDGYTINIPEEQQMLCLQNIDIEDDGELEIDGEVIIL